VLQSRAGPVMKREVRAERVCLLWPLLFDLPVQLRSLTVPVTMVPTRTACARAKAATCLRTVRVFTQANGLPV
jgi:hypothetical protein